MRAESIVPQREQSTPTSETSFISTSHMLASAAGKPVTPCTPVSPFSPTMKVNDPIFVKAFAFTTTTDRVAQVAAEQKLYGGGISTTPEFDWIPVSE